MYIDKNINTNIKVLEERFKDWGDIVKRKIPIGPKKDIWIYVIYIDDMVNRGLIEDTVLQNLMVDIRIAPPGIDEIQSNLFDAFVNGGITTADLKEETDLNKAIDEVLVGNTLLLIDGFNKGIIISSKGFPKRGVDKADTEIVVQGSKESFAESVRTNTVLVRRRIRDTNLKCKQIKVGKRSKTDIAIMYMEDLVRPSILYEAEKRLNDINIDGIMDSGYVEQLIEDSWMSPFPQVQLTERPDKVAAELLEGRIAIVVDNSPFVLLIPTVLASFYQAAEDYYQRWEIMSFVRLIRYVAGFFAFALPALYIALAVYHPSMIPMDLAFKLAGSRQSVPISTVLEVVILELAFEALREAGIRLPSAIGSTLGIVGGIIIGQAAVDAGLVSPMVVIVIALTGICSFAIPNISLVASYRLLKYMMIFMSAILGLFGFWIGLLFILIHLVSLKSFGIPYIFPFAAGEVNGFSDLKDTLLRLPIFTMKKRPIFTNPKEDKRQGKEGE